MQTNPAGKYFMKSIFECRGQMYVINADITSRVMNLCILIGFPRMQ